MSQVVEQELQSYIAALQALSSSRSLEAGDFAEFHRCAEAVVGHQFPGANILVLREDGQQIMNTIVPTGAPLPVRTNLGSTREVFTTGHPVVSDLYVGAVVPRPVKAIDVPVTGSNGNVIYTLSLNPNFGIFADIIRRQAIPPHWLITVVDRRGVIIARVPDGGYVRREEAPMPASSLSRYTSCCIWRGAAPAARISGHQSASLASVGACTAAPAFHSANRIGAGRIPIRPARRSPSTRCSAQMPANNNSMCRGNRPVPAMASRRTAAISASDSS